MGRADLSLKWNLAMLLVVPPMLWVASQYGTMGLAWGLLGLHAALFVPAWFVMVRPLCKATLWEYSVAALRPLFLAIIAVVAGYFAGSVVDDIYLRLGIALLTAGPLYLWLSYLLNREWVVAMMHLGGRGPSLAV